MSVTKTQVVTDLDALRRHRAHQRALEQLFKEHRSDLRAFLVACMGVDERTDLDDIIQEVFLRLARLDDLPQRLPPNTRQTNVSYLISIAHNLVIDRERKRIRRERHLQREKQASREQEFFEDSPEAIVLTRQEMERIKSVILGLKPKWRQAFILSRVKFKTYPEIAQEMGISVKQVEQYMSRALYVVRRALGNAELEATLSKGENG